MGIIEWLAGALLAAMGFLARVFHLRLQDKVDSDEFRRFVKDNENNERQMREELKDLKTEIRINQAQLRTELTDMRNKIFDIWKSFINNPCKPANPNDQSKK